MTNHSKTKLFLFTPDTSVYVDQRVIRIICCLSFMYNFLHITPSAQQFIKPYDCKAQKEQFKTVNETLIIHCQWMKPTQDLSFEKSEKLNRSNTWGKKVGKNLPIFLSLLSLWIFSLCPVLAVTISIKMWGSFALSLWEK